MSFKSSKDLSIRAIHQTKVYLIGNVVYSYRLVCYGTQKVQTNSIQTLSKKYTYSLQTHVLFFDFCLQPNFLIQLGVIWTEKE
jgi:hypothetical protein